MVEKYTQIMGKHKYPPLQADIYLIVLDNTSLNASDEMGDKV